MSLIRLSLAVVALAVVVPAAAANGLAPVKVLPAAVEFAWVAAVQGVKTDDGTTVLQVLRYAEKLRSGKFKMGDFGVAYNGATGEPQTVAIGFWIGTKREPGDAFSILFDVNNENGKIVVLRPKTQYGGTAAEAVISGRDGLLRFIDEQYEENCIDNENGAKLC